MPPPGKQYIRGLEPGASADQQHAAFLDDYRHDAPFWSKGNRSCCLANLTPEVLRVPNASDRFALGPIQTGFDVDLQRRFQLGGFGHFLFDKLGEAFLFVGWEFEDELIVNLQQHLGLQVFAQRVGGKTGSSPA